MNQRFVQYFLTIIFSASVILLLGGAKSGCAGGAPEPAPSMCQTAEACEGLPHIECVGEWSCLNGQCLYECGDPEPESCWSNDDCGAGFECQLEDFCNSPATTEPAGGKIPGDQAADPISVPVCMGQCVPKTDDTCTCNKDCGPNQQCLLPTCPPCPPNALCEPCAETGICIDKPEPQCTGDYDCGKGQFCDVEICEEPTPCLCDDGEDCACIAIAPQCWGTCKDKKIEPECSYDDQCGPGQYCEIEVCADPAPCACDEGEDCACLTIAEECYGTCKDKETKTECSYDGECGDNQFCDYEWCEDGWGCACAEGEECDCPAVEPMCYGTCKEKDVPPPAECSTDSDCSDDEYCESPVCLMWCEDGAADCCGGGACQPKPLPAKCVVSGCSGEICAPTPMASICIYQDWYECLQLSSCQGNDSGGCGWTQNDEFDACMSKYLDADGGTTDAP